MQCPRRGEGGSLQYPGYPKEDGWNYKLRAPRTCSFCGSIHPDDALDLIAAGASVTPTDKSYKMYIDGTGKVYFQHFDQAQRTRFIELVNSKKMKIEYPGYFYVTPFFCKVDDNGEEITNPS